MKEMKDLTIYPAIFEYTQDGIDISFPDLPGCLSCAKTDEEALFMARDVLGTFLVACEDMDKPIPRPSRALHAGENQVVHLVDVWLPFFRDREHSGSVKKNVTVPMWLNSLAEQAGLNFSQVLQAGIKASLGIQDRRQS